MPFCPPVVLGGTDQIGVERPAQATVSGDEHQQDLLDGPPGEQGMGVLLGARGQAREEGQHLIGVRPGVEDVVLGAPQAGRRHHFHRPRNLLRALHGANATANIE